MSVPAALGLKSSFSGDLASAGRSPFCQSSPSSLAELTSRAALFNIQLTDAASAFHRPEDAVMSL
jgi:hypothetical protein